MSRCCLGLGGNLGDVLATFGRAAAMLQDGPARILRVSSVYRTAPVGASAGEAFLNAAVLVETELTPERLLNLLQQIEDASGRTRTIRWGPRTLDLDLLLYDDLVLHTSRLDVPHPGCLYRRFVLDPLSEIAGDWRHPETGLMIGEMRARLLRRALPVAVTGGSPARRAQLQAELQRRAADVQVVEWDIPGEHCGRSLISWLSTPAAGGADNVGAEVHPTQFLNLEAPGGDDLSLLLSVVQAMVDVPVRVGHIPGL